MDEKTLYIILLILVCFFAFIYLLYQIKKNGLRATVIRLIVCAEKNFQKGENREKMNYVIRHFVSILPTPVRFFITEDAVENFIQCIFDEVKEALDYKEAQTNG